jgi:hypothetical protein
VRRHILLLTISLLLASLPLFANTVSVNGTCLQGTCGSPDVLLPGQSTAGNFAGFYTFGNGDAYSITGSWNNSESSDGLTIGIDPIATVKFGNDFMDMLFVQGYQVSFTSGVFGAGLFGTATGSFGGGSTIQFLANINGTPLAGSGVFALPSTFSFFNGSNAVSGITNPLILTFEYQLNFGTGTQPGATVYIDQSVPEPCSLVLLASGLMTGLAAVRKRLM